MKKYSRLTLEEREEISNGLWAGDNLSVIANRLGREVSAISREVENNCRYKRCYRAVRSHKQAIEIRNSQNSWK